MIKKFFASAALLFLPLCCYAFGDATDLSAYLGADFYYFNVKFKDNYGNSIIAKHGYQGAVNGGYRFADNFALELGYSVFATNSKSVFKSQNEVVLARVVPNLNEGHSAKARLHGLHISLLVCSNYFYDDWQAFMSLGFARLKPRVNHKHITSTIASGFPEAYIGHSNKISQPAMFIPRVAAGFSYAFADEAFVKLCALWRNTAKFNNISSEHNEITAKMKDSLGFGFGFYMLF